MCAQTQTQKIARLFMKKNQILSTLVRQKEFALFDKDIIR